LCKAKIQPSALQGKRKGREREREGRVRGGTGKGGKGRGEEGKGGEKEERMNFVLSRLGLWKGNGTINRKLGGQVAY
jgi:hypothetical protein